MAELWCFGSVQHCRGSPRAEMGCIGRNTHRAELSMWTRKGIGRVLVVHIILYSHADAVETGW
jgi:hypothetical protein